MMLMCGCQSGTLAGDSESVSGISLAVRTLLSHLQEPEFDSWTENYDMQATHLWEKKEKTQIFMWCQFLLKLCCLVGMH